MRSERSLEVLNCESCVSTCGPVQPRHSPTVQHPLYRTTHSVPHGTTRSVPPGTTQSVPPGTTQSVLLCRLITRVFSTDPSTARPTQPSQYRSPYRRTRSLVQISLVRIVPPYAQAAVPRVCVSTEEEAREGA
eukprot:2184499-Rhodomonas_salina.1